MKKSLLILALGLATLAHADWTANFQVTKPTAVPTVVKTTAAPTVAPVGGVWVTVSPVPTTTPLTYILSGYVDVFGSMNTTNTDLSTNGVHLGTFQLGINAKNGDDQKMYVELGYGENSAVFTSANGGSSTPHIQQGYVTQNFGKFSVEAGKFIGFLGYELPDPNANFNYTRSQIFLSEPVYNIGLVGKYALTDTTNLIAYGVNENSSDVALDGTHDVGASIQSLGDKFGAAFNWYRDNYKVVDYQHRDLLNAYTYLVLGETTVAVEYLHGDTYLNSGAAYLNVVGPGEISGTLRCVYMNNPGVIPGDTSTQYTLTLKQKHGVITNVAEFIIDSSPSYIYWNSATNTSQNNQTTLVLSTVYSF